MGDRTPLQGNDEVHNNSASDEELSRALFRLADSLLSLNASMKELALRMMDALDTSGLKGLEASAWRGGQHMGSALRSKGQRGRGEEGDAPHRLAYEAAGAPFGAGPQARGIWRLFRQYTTRN